MLRRVQTARDVGNELREIARAAPPPRMASARAAASERENVRFEDEGFWVAVSPFKYTGGNPDVAALAEGLSEEIVTGLSRFSYLKVLARAADQTVTARYVISGSLRQSGSQLRLAVQLVDTISGAHLWAETYDRPFRAEEVFPLQDDLVPRIVSTVADWYGVLPQSMSDVLRLKPADQLTPYRGGLAQLRLRRATHARGTCDGAHRPGTSRSTSTWLWRRMGPAVDHVYGGVRHRVQPSARSSRACAPRGPTSGRRRTIECARPHRPGPRAILPQGVPGVPDCRRIGPLRSTHWTEALSRRWAC